MQDDQFRGFTKKVLGALFINAVVKLLYQKRNTARQGYKTENGAEETALLNVRRIIMPKIDVAKIENYANMTAEEKIAALEAFEYEADNPDAERLKAAVSKANSEAAELKRQLKARMTEDEQKEAERAAREAERDALLESLKRDKAVSERKAKYLAFGYDEKLAAETAKAFADGDMDTVDKNHALHIENVRKAERAAALANDPKPPAGSGGDAKITKEQFGEMGYAEQLKVFNEQPELYKQLTGGTNNG